MKTLKKVPFQLIEVEYIPEVKDMLFGAFYYARQWQSSNHLCPCGCRNQTPLPIKEGEWIITDEDKLTLTPSVQHRYDCKSHYVIQNGSANMLNEPLPKQQWTVPLDGRYIGFDDAQPGE